MGWWVQAATGVGSSPLARGLRKSRVKYSEVWRIIPARAGFTGSRGEGRDEMWDHPRSRGVYTEGWMPMASLAGSSPLARGLRPGPMRPHSGRGIIPARAGFTSHGYGLEIPGWDHPRSRGVYGSPAASRTATIGSSPLARGLPADHSDQPPQNRIIPARAGFTNMKTGIKTIWEDHPRSRGVYGPDGLEGAPEEGSSPLARGLPGLHVVERGFNGIIPARAGFTRQRPGRRS